MRRAPPSKRRAPRQARARATIDAILIAASTLARKGPRALNTNVIAERAGVSIGTLYEYFPNKQAILVAVARRQLEQDRDVMIEAIALREGERIEEMVHRVLKALIALHAHEHRVRRMAMTEHLAQGHEPEHTQVIASVAQRLSAMPLGLSPTSLFVLSRSVIGTIHAALREAPALLESRSFETQLLRLALGFLRSEGPQKTEQSARGSRA